MQITLYTIILASSALVTGLISLYILKCRTCRASYEFAILLAAMSWWSAMIAFESLSQTLDQKIFFSIASYPGSQFSPVIYLLFALKYTGMDSWLSARRKGMLFIIPFISLMMAVTNAGHHLLWADISLAKSVFAGTYVIYTHGPWYWIEVAYSYSLLFTGMFAFFLVSFRYPLLNSLQCRLILLASLFPIAGNIGYAFFFTQLEGIDPTTLLLSVGDVLIAIVITRFWFLDIVPIAREQVLESMNEGMVILDLKNRIVDINPSARHLFRIPDAKGGQVITDILPWWTTGLDAIAERSGRFSFPGGNGRTQWIEWSASEIRNQEEGTAGVCLLTQDVTFRHEMEEQLRNQAVHLEELTKELSSAHKSLQLMTSITRHDILNMITVQRGYMEMALETKTPNDYETAIKNSYPAALKIQELIAFTHEYQDFGTGHSSWRNLSGIIRKVSGLFHGEQGEVVSSIPDTIEIHVDSLFEKVFYVLIDNALRHGVRVTEIRFSYQITGEFRIICEDNGIGIPASEKETIFHQGIGENTGLGLYLAREILMMHACTIHETGNPGSGGRFEISIPRGRWKILKKNNRKNHTT